jgi:hypothetical protein
MGVTDFYALWYLRILTFFNVYVLETLRLVPKTFGDAIWSVTFTFYGAAYVVCNYV